MVNGVINIYKEKGYTSHDVVAKLRGIFHQKKIGHTGTLDPEAEGVLPVCLGVATKLCEFLADHDKTYEAVLLLGVETDTQDLTGTILRREEVTASPEEAERTILSFLGTHEQIPPMYSARKVNGKKLYELARKGQTVERAATTVQILEIEILWIRLPEIAFRVTCSKGTYIRALCHDIGQALGCGGCMKQLTRTRVGDFQIEDSIRLGELEALTRQVPEKAENEDAGGKETEQIPKEADSVLIPAEEKRGQILGSRIIPIDQILSQYLAMTVRAEAERLLYNGNPLEERHFQKMREPEQMQNTVQNGSGEAVQRGMRYRVYDTSGKFCALYAWQPEKRRYCPVKMFL